MSNRGYRVVLALYVALVLTAVAVAACQREAPVERSYNTACYREQGGDKWVCGDGGELELQSGATLDIQSGATTDFSGGMDLDGALLDLDADGDTSLQADTDDQIDVEISGSDDFQFTANTFTVLAGSSITMPATADLTAYGYVAVGDGTPDGAVTAGNDEELYVEGELEVDGEAEFDGAIDADSTANIAGAVTLGSTLDVSGGDVTLENDEILSNSTDGVVRTDGQWGFKGYVLDKTANHTVAASESGAWFTNDGASGEITFTLPAVADGLFYCFIANDNQTVTLDPDGSEQILSETNAGGDRCQSGAQFDVLCLLGVTDGWVPVETTGTWSDAN